MAKTPASLADWKMALEDEPEGSFPVFVIQGGGDGKGTGKTTTFGSLLDPSPEATETMAIFSFDEKVRSILRAQMIPTMGEANFRKRVRILNVRKKYRFNEDNWTKTAAEAHAAIIDDLRTIEQAGGVDLVVHDGLEILSEIEEMRMRFKFHFGPFDKISWEPWKHRTLGLRDILNQSQRSAKRSVVFTAYPKVVEEIKDGVVVGTREVPKWMDLIEKMTDVWLVADRHEKSTKSGIETRFTVFVRSSKLNAMFPTGHTYDVTNTTLGRVVGYDKLALLAGAKHGTIDPESPLAIAAAPAAPRAVAPVAGSAAATVEDPFA